MGLSIASSPSEPSADELDGRLRQLALVSASLGHELNNPLAYLIGNLELIGMRLSRTGGDDELSELLREASSGAERIRRIVSDLGLLGRAEGGDRGLDPGRCARVAVELCKAELRPRAQLELGLGPPAQCPGDAPALVLGIQELLLHAVSGLEPGRMSEHRVRLRTFTEGTRAVIEVGVEGPAPIGDRHLSLCRAALSRCGAELTQRDEEGLPLPLRISLPLLG